MPDIAQLSPLAWAMLVLGAVIVGLTKTGLPGIIPIAIALFAAVLPAKASTGALLLTLIVGDVFALLIYRKYTDWPTLFRLMPTVLLGIAAGAVFLAFSSDDWVRRGIAVILLALMGFTLWQRRPPDQEELGVRVSPLARVTYGTLSGFTTMVANAGGPVLSMYLLAARFQVFAFLGTAAWFFAVINLTKVPISIGLGLITLDTLFVVMLLVPAVTLGALIGRVVAKKIKQSAFDAVVIVGTIIGSLYLLFA